MLTVLRRRRATWWAVGLVVAFVAVQFFVLRLGWELPNQPMGDVYNVYLPWSEQAFRGDVVGVSEPWVYPPLALLPMLVPWAFGMPDYTLAWGMFVVLLNVGAFAFLVGDGRSLPRRWAAGFWTLFALAFGPVALFRIDGVTVPIAVLAVLVIAQRPAVAATLLAVGAWIKIWPGAVLLAGVAVLRSRVRMLVAATVVSGIVCALVIAGGGAQHLFGFLAEQSDRGLQLEAPISTPYAWAAALGLPGAAVVYNQEIVTFQVTGDGADLLSSVMTPVLVIVSVGMSVWAFFRTRAGVAARRLLPPLALALVLAFIVCNKVGSPQFQVWLIAPIVLWLLWARRTAVPYAAVAVVIAVLTQFVYPIMYDRLTAAATDAVLVLTLRNALLVGLFIGVLVHLFRVPVPAEKTLAKMESHQ